MDNMSNTNTGESAVDSSRNTQEIVLDKNRNGLPAMIAVIVAYAAADREFRKSVLKWS